jgi:hypothetical protein
MNNDSNVGILIFYGALFFTCVVGIIELLPEFNNWLRYDEWMGILFQIALSLLKSARKNMREVEKHSREIDAH